MVGPGGKLREAVATAGEHVAAAAKDTSKLIIAALAIAAAALLTSLVSLLAVLSLRRQVVAHAG